MLKENFRKLTLTKVVFLSMQCRLDQKNSAWSSSVFWFREFWVNGGKKFKKGATFKIYENITFYPSFHSSELKGAAAEHDKSIYRLEIIRKCSVELNLHAGEEYVLPFSAQLQVCTVLHCTHTGEILAVIAYIFWAGSGVFFFFFFTRHLFVEKNPLFIKIKTFLK